MLILHHVLLNSLTADVLMQVMQYGLTNRGWSNSPLGLLCCGSEEHIWSYGAQYESSHQIQADVFPEQVTMHIFDVLAVYMWILRYRFINCASDRSALKLSAELASQ